MKLIICYFIAINAAAFALMLADKFKARHNLWRIPERVLLGSAALGGSLGALAGMYLVRHKTRHWQFAVGIPAMLAVQAVGSIWLWSRFFS